VIRVKNLTRCLENAVHAGRATTLLMGANAFLVVLELLQTSQPSQIASCVILEAGRKRLVVSLAASVLSGGTVVQQTKDARNADQVSSQIKRAVKIAPAVRQDHGLKRWLPASAQNVLPL